MSYIHFFSYTFQALHTAGLGLGDQLQFGFKQGYSTGRAIWLVQEVLQHYLRQGSKPVAVVLVCTIQKAFDLGKFNIMFGRFLERGTPSIVVRVIAFSYTKQVVWVGWVRSCCSSTFRISTGTKQGSFSCLDFWNVYLDPLFAVL